MRQISLALLIIFSLLLAGCDGTEPAPTATPAGGGTGPLPTVGATDPVPSPTTDDYPAPPTPTTTTQGYAAPLPPPTVDPYPVGDTVPTGVLIYRPLGNQCQDPATYDYPTLVDAVADLEAAGVLVYDAEETARTVCEGCEVCPTSEHFEAIINPEGLDAAAALGWLRQE